MERSIFCFATALKLAAGFSRLVLEGHSFTMLYFRFNTWIQIKHIPWTVYGMDVLMSCNSFTSTSSTEKVIFFQPGQRDVYLPQPLFLVSEGWNENNRTLTDSEGWKYDLTPVFREKWGNLQKKVGELLRSCHLANHTSQGFTPWEIEK